MSLQFFVSSVGRKQVFLKLDEFFDKMPKFTKAAAAIFSFNFGDVVHWCDVL